MLQARLPLRRVSARGRRRQRQYLRRRRKRAPRQSDLRLRCCVAGVSVSSPTLGALLLGRLWPFSFLSLTVLFTVKRWAWAGKGSPTPHAGRRPRPLTLLRYLSSLLTVAFLTQKLNVTLGV